MQTIISIVVDKDMVERFRQIQRALDVNTRTMAAKSGVSDDKLYQFLAGRQNLTLESLRLLKGAYPDISTDYLISGRGVPLLSLAAVPDDERTRLVTALQNIRHEVNKGLGNE